MAVDLRSHLFRSLEADLVGPYSLDPTSTERLSRAPLSWYMAGFLAPANSAPVDPLEEDGGDAPGDDEDDPETGPAEPGPRQPHRLPSSVGLSVFLPSGATSLTVKVRYAAYELEPPSGEERATWLRRPCALERDVSLEELARGVEIAKGVCIEGTVAHARVPGVAASMLAVTLFLVNRKAVPSKEEKLDSACLFQVELEVTHPRGLEPRPDRRDEGSREFDEQVVDLQFRDRVEWAVGHGVSAEPIREGERVVGARTVWLPTHEVPRVDAREIEGVTLEMERLAELPDAKSVREALEAIPERYGEWISEQRAVVLDSDERRETRETLAIQMEWAQKRIAAGVELLAGSDPQILPAFRVANRAMADAARKRSPERYGPDRRPKWRLFQLAFVLLSLQGVADEANPDRKIVDLIILPDRRRQDRGVPRSHRVRSRPAATARRDAPRCRPRGRRAAALHAAPVDPRPARSRRNAHVRHGTAPAHEPPRARTGALRRRSLGRAFGDGQHIRGDPRSCFAPGQGTLEHADP
jgi:hypothetical protein